MKRMLPPVILLIFLALLAMVYRNSRRLFMPPMRGISSPGEVEALLVPADENTGIEFDIKGFRSDKGFILFLPTRTKLDRVVYYALDGEGDYLERFETDFTISDDLIAGSIPVSARCSDLPSVEIELEGTSLQEVDDSDDHMVRAPGELVVTCRDEIAESLGCPVRTAARDKDPGRPGAFTLKGHGNASWLLDKKSYNLSLEGYHSLLGMDEGSSYVLLAAAIDKSLIRNSIFFRLARQCGLADTPVIRHVDLFVNGDYRGCYCLATKVEAARGRIDIAEGRDFLYRWGMPDEAAMPLEVDVFRDSLTNVVEIRDLKDQSLAGRAFRIAESMMEAIADTDSDDYLDYVDTDSWARYYWVQEFSKNTDATSRSLYTIWHGQDGIMTMGPVWDMDQTAGVVEPYGRSVDYLYPTGWAVREEEWYVPLFEHPGFADCVDEMYHSGGVRQALEECSGWVDEMASEIRYSAEMNFDRWGDLEAEENNQIVYWMGSSTLDTQTEWVKEWLKQRFEWIDGEMKDE